MSESERGKSRTSRWTDLPMHRSVKILWIFWKWNNVFAFSPAERASQFAVWSTNCYLFCVELEFDYITELLSHVLLMAKNEKSGGKKSRSHLFVDTLNETFFCLLFHEFSCRICNFAGNSLRIEFLVSLERSLASGVAVEREIQYCKMSNAEKI